MKRSKKNPNAIIEAKPTEKLPEVLFSSNIIGLENLPRYTVGKMIGTGKNDVYEVIDTASGKTFAAKFVKPEETADWFFANPKPDNWDVTQNEALLGYELGIDHSGVIKTVDYIEQEPWRIIIQEKAEGPTLR